MNLFKYIFLGVTAACLLVACGVENNINFSVTEGSCANGVTNAPYCMAIKIQNNNSGQNYINSTNFPIKNLSLSISGASNVFYPTVQGSSYDPNGCLGKSINPGSDCTFYLWLSGESIPVGQKQAIAITANYTVNNKLFSDGSSSASSKLTVYETPSLLITGAPNNLAYIESYNINGLSASYYAESGNDTFVSMTNDNYYGFLYMAGNNGIYYSGLGKYLGALPNTPTGSYTNILVSGLNIYSTNTNSGVWSESYLSGGWSNRISTNQAFSNNIIGLSGNYLLLSYASTNTAWSCNLNSTSTSCAQEGVVLNAPVLAINYSPSLGTISGSNLTGLVVGNSKGLWLESNPSSTSLGCTTCTWYQAIQPDGVTPYSASVVVMTSDGNSGLFIADTTGTIYRLITGMNGILQAYTTVSGTPYAMVYDYNGSKLYVGTSNGIYSCTTAGCSFINAVSNLQPIKGLSIITSLTSS